MAILVGDGVGGTQTVERGLGLIVTAFDTSWLTIDWDDDLLGQVHDWLEALSPSMLANLLFDWGVIGYWSSRAKKYVLPYDVNSDMRGFLRSGKLRINPAFLKAFGFTKS